MAPATVELLLYFAGSMAGEMPRQHGLPHAPQRWLLPVEESLRLLLADELRHPLRPRQLPNELGQSKLGRGVMVSGPEAVLVGHNPDAQGHLSWTPRIALAAQPLEPYFADLKPGFGCWPVALPAGRL